MTNEDFDNYTSKGNLICTTSMVCLQGEIKLPTLCNEQCYLFTQYFYVFICLHFK